MTPWASFKGFRGCDLSLQKYNPFNIREGSQIKDFASPFVLNSGTEPRFRFRYHAWLYGCPGCHYYYFPDTGCYQNRSDSVTNSLRWDLDFGTGNSYFSHYVSKFQSFKLRSLVRV